MVRRLRSGPIFVLSLTALSVSLISHITSGELLELGELNETKSSRNLSLPHPNASALLQDLLDGYDIRLRPGFGGTALGLTMDIIIASFDSISEVDMDFTITMYLHQYWEDERLAWDDDVDIQDMTLSGQFAEKIWVPDTFLANDKHSYIHDVTEKNKMLRLSRNGGIAYGMRFTSTLACSMDLRNFPLDSQNCTVEIESYGYTKHEVDMKWNEHPVFGVDKAEVPQFRILGYDTVDSVVKTATGEYQRLSLVFRLKRSVGYFIFQTYLPCVLIVMLSWVSFWINHEATSARVALGITTVLTMTTISTGVRQSLPRISYVKSIDIYLVMCFVFVFAALLEYAAVNYSYWGRRSRTRTADEGWPANGEVGGNKEDRESAVNIKEWATPKSFAELSQEVVSETTTSVQNSVDSKRNSTIRDGGTKVVFRKRASSPIPELCPEGGEAEIVDDSGPEYPRYATGVRTRTTFTNRARRRLTIAQARGASLKKSIHRLGKKATSAIPSFRVKDVNVIDKHSRVVFPMCFIIFNLFYWGYYTMLA